MLAIAVGGVLRSTYNSGYRAGAAESTQLCEESMNALKQGHDSKVATLQSLADATLRDSQRKTKEFGAQLAKVQADRRRKQLEELPSSPTLEAHPVSSELAVNLEDLHHLTAVALAASVPAASASASKAKP